MTGSVLRTQLSIIRFPRDGIPCSLLYHKNLLSNHDPVLSHLFPSLSMHPSLKLQNSLLSSIALSSVRIGFVLTESFLFFLESFPQKSNSSVSYRRVVLSKKKGGLGVVSPPRKDPDVGLGQNEHNCHGNAGLKGLPILWGLHLWEPYFKHAFMKFFHWISIIGF